MRLKKTYARRGHIHGRTHTRRGHAHGRQAGRGACDMHIKETCTQKKHLHKETYI